MRKYLLLFLVSMLLFSLCSCEMPPDEVIESLPEYKSRVFYTEGVFQDYTDYGIYTYENIDESVFEKSIYFKKVPEDKSDLMSYLDNYESWIELSRSGEKYSELGNKYDFDRGIIDESDYYYIKSKEGQPIGNSVFQKFSSYNIYFFDTATNTLYYFHNNI